MAQSSGENPTTFTVDRLCGITSARRSVEEELLAAGVLLPLSGRVGWLEAFPAARSCLHVARDASGRPIGAMAVEKASSRALPGHSIWRVRHVDPCAPFGVSTVVIDDILKAARKDLRTLRVHFDIFSPDATAREAFVPLLCSRSLTKLADPRDHQWTLIVDLSNGADAVWSALAGVRKKVRLVERAPLETRVIADESLASRMKHLLAETYARTGGETQSIDFAGLVRLGKVLPSASRTIGLFRTDVEGPDSLVAFAWGIRNGSHVCYDVGASSSDPAVRRYPLGYALVWALMTWGANTGAKWYDLGGVTKGTTGSDDELGGISDFKRHFSRTVVEVREEWQYEPHPFSAWLAHGLKWGVAVLKRGQVLFRHPLVVSGHPKMTIAADDAVEKQQD